MLLVFPLVSPKGKAGDSNSFWRAIITLKAFIFKGFRLFYFFAVVDGLPASRLASAFASSAGAVPKALCVCRFALYRFACGDPVLIYNI